MNKLIEIDGRVIHISSKTIEINGEKVTTQGEITIINQLPHHWEHILPKQNAPLPQSDSLQSA